MILGFAAIGCAILGISIAGTRDRIGKIGLVVATVGWLIGSTLAILLGRSVISLGLA
jgi:hypothetical protein